ncbi:hypothetical protein [Streptomyces globisporus]|uniref:hypothetical protein n=1 Tax=Streptomyces globisporus TaxID=1908 RepID=UPI0033E75E33
MRIHPLTPLAPATRPAGSPAGTLTRRRTLAASGPGGRPRPRHPPSAGTAVAASSTCLNGALAYEHDDAEAGTSKPQVTRQARNSDWELWGRETTAGQVERLSSGLTSATDGRFSACYTGTTAPRDVHVRFFSSAEDLWRVVRAGAAKPRDPNWRNETQYTGRRLACTPPQRRTPIGARTRPPLFTPGNLVGHIRPGP